MEMFSHVEKKADFAEKSAEQQRPSSLLYSTRGSPDGADLTSFWSNFKSASEGTQILTLTPNDRLLLILMLA